MSNKRAYTLVELILVVAIIVMLSGAAIYGIGASIRNANEQKELAERHDYGFEPDALDAINNYHLNRGDDSLYVSPTPAGGATTTTTSETSASDTTQVIGGGDGTSSSSSETSSTSETSGTTGGGSGVYSGSARIADRWGSGCNVVASCSTLPENTTSVTIVIRVASSSLTAASFNGTNATVDSGAGTLTMTLTNADQINAVRGGWAYINVSGNEITTATVLSVTASCS